MPAGVDHRQEPGGAALETAGQGMLNLGVFKEGSDELAVSRIRVAVPPGQIKKVKFLS